MTRSGVVRSLVSFVAVIGFSLTPLPTFAQHGGGSHGGGGGFHGGGGGGFHSGGGGGFHGSGGFSRGSAAGSRGGGFQGGGRSEGAGNPSRGGPSEAGRNPGSSRSQASNVHPAISDGQWHSFGNSGSNAHLSGERASGGLANSTLSAHAVGSAGGGWNSFGSSRGTAGFVGGGFKGFGWRGGWGGYGWGRGWGWGGLSFGIGWPYWGFYWGPTWAFGWDPWWYGPAWYGPYGYGVWPAYSYYPDYSDYSYDWSNNPPPYRMDSSNDNHLQGYPVRPSSNGADYGFDVNSGGSQESGGSAQNAGPRPSQLEAAPSSPAPPAQSSPRLGSVTMI